jgi:hypothetical protein
MTERELLDHVLCADVATGGTGLCALRFVVHYLPFVRVLCIAYCKDYGRNGDMKRQVRLGVHVHCTINHFWQRIRWFPPFWEQVCVQASQ